ncbi:MAG: hypothetical protein RLZZ142_983 [Verrucomicrobiota bacterium]
MLQLNRIGELVLTTPALHALRQTWPQCHLTLVCRDTCQSLVECLPRIDQTLLLESDLNIRLSLLRRILAGQFDLCLDFTGTDRSALLSLSSRANHRIAFSTALKGPLRSLIYQKFVPVSDSRIHAIDRMLELLTPLGIPLPSPPASPVLSVPPLARHRITQLVTECGMQKAFALLHPGSASADKYWPPERWAELILALQHQHGLPCVITGGSDPAEQEHLRAIRTALALLSSGPLPLPLVPLAGQLDLALMAALVEKAALVVSSDTAAVHMASAFGKPQITLFGPTNPFFWGARHALAFALCAASPDAPTPPAQFHPNAPDAPMSAIPTSAVLNACSQLLALVSPQA